ncbi:hypothetical protein VB780_12395 [Leptolyngbya sp. CCNP1308]|uniref:hypothetical protein n=1 Tax=Leptolyngbya sp. CCNP1308 TaxID=3110255 RepID=UPI002B209A1F|nr:hypothetical protein [Leptolyngbya sp. CCNP1308]MEA5449374.1 hypothetical protein [Leptolyngbya sp. CCNP1308]
MELHRRPRSSGYLIHVPKGYEIYENPNAQVFLRKIQPQIITPEEVAIVQAGVKKTAKLDYFMVDVKGKHIVVYLCDQNANALMAIAQSSSTGDAGLADRMAQSFTYSPMMQFVLVDEETREFEVERWCFRGSIDDWIMLDSSTNLQALVKKYARHLGQESFYELMP